MKKNKDFDRWEALCRDANDEYAIKALSQYADGNLHKGNLIAESLGDSYALEIENFKHRRVTANFVFACCAGCFADILSSKIEYTYTAYSAFNTIQESGSSVPPFPDKVPDLSTQAKLENFLKRNGFDRLYTFHEPVWEDIERRTTYVKMLRELLKTGATLAKEIGDEACSREFLNALRLTLNRSSDVVVVSQEVDSLMTYDEAKNLYSIIESALASLWVSMEYRKLKPLTMGRKKAR